MPGMQSLGRIFDVVGTGAANPIALRNASAITYIVKASGAATITVQGQTAFSGGTSTNWTAANSFVQPTVWYQNTTSDGTGHWTKQTASWSTATLTLAGTSGYMSVVTFYASQFAAGYNYINISANANTTYIIGVVHDLLVQRTPANLMLLGA